MPHYDEISVAVMAPMDDVVKVDEQAPPPQDDGAAEPDEESSEEAGPSGGTLTPDLGGAP